MNAGMHLKRAASSIPFCSSILARCHAQVPSTLPPRTLPQILYPNIPTLIIQQRHASSSHALISSHRNPLYPPPHQRNPPRPRQHEQVHHPRLTPHSPRPPGPTVSPTYAHSPSSERKILDLIRYLEIQAADETGRRYYLYLDLNTSKREAAFIVLVVGLAPGHIALVPMPHFLELRTQTPNGKAYVFG
jgi:hypothetical protein